MCRSCGAGAPLDAHFCPQCSKILALGLAGMGLHAWSISYCDSALTDGFIPKAMVPQVALVQQGMKALLESGMWKPVDGGYQLHDYLSHNRSRATVLAKREADRHRRESAVNRNGIRRDSP